MASKTQRAVKEDHRDLVRIAFRLHGPELVQIRDVQEMLSLNSELDAVRYLMQRGLEAMSATLASRKASTSMASRMSMEELIDKMIPKLQAMEKEGKL